MKLKTDFHIHTADDPIDNIGYSSMQLISRAAERGFNAIAITNHNRVTYNVDLNTFAIDKGVLLIPGIEKSIEGKHTLLLNVSPSAEKIKTFRELENAKREDDIFVVAPHPFFKKRFCLEDKLIEHIELFDAIEFTFFYSRLINFNKKAVRVAKEFNLPVVGNSDSHVLRHFGNCHSRIQSRSLTISDVFKGIRNHQAQVVSSPLSLVGMLASYLEMQYSLYKNSAGKEKIGTNPKGILGYLKSTSAS